MRLVLTMNDEEIAKIKGIKVMGFNIYDLLYKNKSPITIGQEGVYSDGTNKHRVVVENVNITEDNTVITLKDIDNCNTYEISEAVYRGSFK